MAPQTARDAVRPIQPDQTGFLFICNDQTYDECISRMLFGLPRGKLNEMKRHIKVADGEGAPPTWLYLFNPQKALLYGVYEAVSEPSLDIDRDAWKKRPNPATGSPFPAQVKVRRRSSLPPAKCPRKTLPTGPLNSSNLVVADRIMNQKR